MSIGSRVRNKDLPVGVCDQSGFLYNLRDLVKQKAWQGDCLEWTGLMVAKDQLDIPNDQTRPFKGKPEGILPPDARPQTNLPVMPYGPTLTPAQIFAQLEELVNNPPEPPIGSDE